MRWRTGKNTRDDRGASAVEFALVVVPLLMVIAGIVNFGVVFAQQLALDNSVRAGARAVVVDTGKSATTVDAGPVQLHRTRTIAGGHRRRDESRRGWIDVQGQHVRFEPRRARDGEHEVPHPVAAALVRPKTVTLSSQAEFQCEYQ